MKRKTILITGGSGFIGSNLIEHFVNKKYKVINLDKLSYASTPDKFKSFYRNKNYIFIRMNLSNTKGLVKIINKYKPSTIFNSIMKPVIPYLHTRLLSNHTLYK